MCCPSGRRLNSAARTGVTWGGPGKLVCPCSSVYRGTPTSAFVGATRVHWRTVAHGHSVVLVLTACFMLGGLVSGCAAKPAGRLFPPIDPPVVWPAAPKQARIKLVGVLADSGDLKAAQSSSEVFKAALRGPRPLIRFAAPHSVAARGDGLLAVADGSASVVHIIDLENRGHCTVSGWGDEEFRVPLGVCWAGDRILVTDAGRHEVVELDREGGCRRCFGQDVLSRPVGITYVATRDQVYVVDGGAHCLVVFDASGALVRKIGGPGQDKGQFNYPSHICWDKGDKLLVADSGNFRVQILDVDGACLQVMGQKGDGAGDFSLPKGVAIDREGHIYVVDAHFENVQVFDAGGQLLLAFGQEGGGLGEFSLPAGLSIDDDDQIWVADSANRRVQVFEYLRNTG